MNTAAAGLHSRAQALLRGPCCLSRQEGEISAVGLISRYVRGESWQDPKLRQMLADGLARTRELAKAPGANRGPARDARNFYEKSAAILGEIEADVSAGRL